MGSVTSKPKVAVAQQQPAQQIIYTQSPTTIPVTPIEASPDEIAKTRVENVLRRARSTIGNIFTSFRGVLSENNATPQRKSLLGE